LSYSVSPPPALYPLSLHDALPIFALATVSVGFARRRPWFGLVAVTVVALGLTYGWPVFTELRRLPGLSLAANTRFLFIAAFSLRSEEHTSELQSLRHLVCRLLLEK